MPNRALTDKDFKEWAVEFNKKYNSTIHRGRRIKRVPAKREPVVKVRKRIRKVGKKATRWARFRKEILKRDQNTCKRCGREAAHVHHKKKRSTHPELVFVRRNCISLCESCHRAEHEE